MENNKPPLFKSWKGWYLLLVGVLLAQIIIYYWMTSKLS